MQHQAAMVLKSHLLGNSLKKIRENQKTFKGLSTQALVFQKFSDSILAGVQKLQQCAVSHLLISETDNLSTTVGVISKRDILLYVIKNFTTDTRVDVILDERLDNLNIGTTGTTLVCAKKDHTLRNVLAEIRKHKYSCIPVVDENQVFLGAINKAHVSLIFRDSCYHMVGKCEPAGLQGC